MSHKQIHEEKQQKIAVLQMKFHQFFTLSSSSSLEMFKYVIILMIIWQNYPTFAAYFPKFVLKNIFSGCNQFM